MRSMDLFQYERKVRVYNIAKQICNVFSKFLGVKETVPQLKKTSQGRGRRTSFGQKQEGNGV